MRRTIRKHKFQAWLEDNRFRSVGIPASNDACPIASYLSETYDELTMISVNADDVEYFDENTQRWYFLSLPEWARKFIVHVDDRYSSMHEIQGRQALEAL